MVDITQNRLNLADLGSTPVPRPRPDAAPIYSTQEGNTEMINNNISMAHPARLQRMNDMLRAGLIPQSTYDDYMRMIGR